MTLTLQLRYVIVHMYSSTRTDAESKFTTAVVPKFRQGLYLSPGTCTAVPVSQILKLILVGIFNTMFDLKSVFVFLVLKIHVL